MKFLMTALVFMATAHAEDPVHQIRIKDHRFHPEELMVRTGETFWLEVINEDAVTEEFESTSLKIEKIIPPRKTIRIRVKQIAGGSHDIFGEFHMETCKGLIVAKELP